MAASLLGRSRGFQWAVLLLAMSGNGGRWAARTCFGGVAVVCAVSLDGRAGRIRSADRARSPPCGVVVVAW